MIGSNPFLGDMHGRSLSTFLCRVHIVPSRLYLLLFPCRTLKSHEKHAQSAGYPKADNLYESLTALLNSSAVIPLFSSHRRDLISDISKVLPVNAKHLGGRVLRRILNPPQAAVCSLFPQRRTTTTAILVTRTTNEQAQRSGVEKLLAWQCV